MSFNIFSIARCFLEISASLDSIRYCVCLLHFNNVKNILDELVLSGLEPCLSLEMRVSCLGLFLQHYIAIVNIPDAPHVYVL